jgi:hypothetical protein
MKTTKLILALIISGFSSACAFSQGCSIKATADQVKENKDLAGDWIGEYVENGRSYPVQISISEKNGTFTVFIQNEGMPDKNIKADLSVCGPTKFHFFGKLPNGEEFRYNPWLKNGQLEGTYQEGQICKKDAPKFSARKKTVN